MSKRLSAESLPIFQEGIFLILSRWSALQLAVENEWGGRGSGQLADQLGSDIFSWFTQSKEPLYIDDLENILDEGMLSLNTMIEDGSVEEVAEKLMIMHEECLEGNYNSIEKLRQAGPRTGAHQHIRQIARASIHSGGRNKVISGVSLSPRNTSGYLRTSLRCRQESLRIKSATPRKSPVGKLTASLIGSNQLQKFCSTRSPVISRNKQTTAQISRKELNSPHKFLIKSPTSASKFQVKIKSPPAVSLSPNRAANLSKKSPSRAANLSKKSPMVSTASKLRVIFSFKIGQQIGFFVEKQEKYTEE
ncbi:hypothetical protein GH714_042221 [Hevea brasiliensis]|uniref:Pre-rRNA-processing protein TSR2 homolog n=1 Tax=Hevea brasiliensis TaxID=3981 RepID=A0A6A6MTI7_HEVBR|nr:hypothetical protein GH714_042221 [Hevea brasiliensis]